MASPSLSSPLGASPPERRADVLLAGAGLANGLLALRLKAERPDLRVVAFDARAPDVEDAHTWCFFSTDVAAPVRRWLEPLAGHRWRGYDVRFPTHSRTLDADYAAITGPGLQRAVQDALGPDLRLGARVVSLEPQAVVLEGGERWTAPLVVDGRGARRSEALSLAWQKFVGLELQLDGPHGLERPTIMDASVVQADGYRFVYLLPFAPDRLLVEDTYYSDKPVLDAALLERRIADYAAGRGWRVREVVRREAGVLPIALGGDIDAYLAEAQAGVPCVGLRAPLFNPVTGYSLPDAAALAHEIAAAPELISSVVAALVQARVRRRWRETAFLRALNRIMFLAAEPDRRYRVLERFYRLSEPLIARFYAGETTWTDRARILVGQPPVGVGRALRALPEAALGRRAAA